MIKKIEIQNFTCFADFKTELVPGVNLFIGDNGTGKTLVFTEKTWNVKLAHCPVKRII